MTRFRFLLALFVAPLLILSACSDSLGSAAATVNGTEISDSDFRDLLKTMADHPDFAAGLVALPPRADGGDTKNSVDSDFAAALLEIEILLELIDQEFNDRGLKLTEEDLAVTRESFDPQLVEILAELPEKYSDSFERWNTQLALIRDDLASEMEAAGEEITQEQIDAYYQENLAVFESQVCAKHILVDTETEANDLIDQLAGGADFGQLAGELSIDPSAAANQGDLGCQQPELYVAPFAEAIKSGEVGKVLGPVDTDFGFHVIIVTARGVSKEDAVEQVRSELEAQQAGGPAAALGALIEKLVINAKVDLNSRYGSWDEELGRVDPPAVPEGETGSLTLQ